MLIMVVCGALLLAGLAAGALWSGRPFCPPAGDSELSVGEVARRFVWYASLALVAGVTAGLTVIGGGGRLAMRLLAVTAGHDAQGRVTEADEIVGRITAGGTIGFITFVGILGGVAGVALYLLLRRLLPPGRLGGMAFGFGLLVVLGTTMDPLRKDNRDFDIVGPGWLAVVVFTALAVAFGITVAGMSARLSAWLPLPSTERRVLVRYALPAVFAAIAFSVTAILIVVCVVVMAVTRWRPVVDAVRSARAVLVERVIAVALPNAVGSIVDIAGR